MRNQIRVSTPLESNAQSHVRIPRPGKLPPNRLSTVATRTNHHLLSGQHCRRLRHRLARLLTRINWAALQVPILLSASSTHRCSRATDRHQPVQNLYKRSRAAPTQCPRLAIQPASACSPAARYPQKLRGRTPERTLSHTLDILTGPLQLLQPPGE